MTNAMLRQKAWRTYWRNRGQMWFLFLLISLLNSGLLIVYRLTSVDAQISPILTLLYSLAIMPLTAFGMNLVLLRLIRGKKAKAFMMFHIFKPPFHPLKVYASSVIPLLPNLLLSAATFTSAPMVDTLGQLIAYFLIVLFVIIMFIWFQIRLFVFPYYMITHPEEGIWEQFKTSFRQMKGQVRHLLWFSITVTFPLIIVLIALVVLFFNKLTQPANPQIVTNTLMFGNIFLTTFISPYFYLAYAAFANQQLNPKS